MVYYFFGETMLYRLTNILLVWWDCFVDLGVVPCCAVWDGVK